MINAQQGKNTALGLRRDPVFIVLTAFMTLVLMLFIVYPVFSVLIKSFTSDGGFSVSNYGDFFRFSYYYKSIINSLLLGVITTSIILIIAFALSYTVSKTNMPLKGFLRVCSLLPLISPPFIFSLALIIIAGRRGLIYQFLGISPTIYGWPGLIISQVLSFLPLGFLMVNNVLQSLNPTLEDASGDLGASQVKTLLKVIVPLSFPGLFKAALLVFIMSLADFGNPMLIGGGVPIMATDAYNLWIGEQNIEMAAVFSVLLIIPSIFVYVIQNYFLKEGSFITVSGQMTGTERRKIVWYIKYPFYALSLFVCLTIIACFTVIFISSVTKLFMINNKLTLEHFSSYTGWKALQTSLTVSGIAAVITSFTSVIFAYILVRKKPPARDLLEFVALLGFAVPGTVMGIGYILVFNKPPFLITGTIFIIVLNISFREFPVGLEAGIGKLHQIDVSMEEASRDLGAGSFKTFVSTALPLMSSAIAASFLYTFMVGMITISAVIFLIAPGTNLASLLILRLAETGNIGMASAMAVMLTLVVFASLMLLRIISKKSRLEMLKGF
ncbi:MAG TPA: iron ABC transporter permease [Spirochaetes bacterium]|nr:iron ABC transporter permease [Spirochaetota bacterium]